jgi:transposase
MSPPCPCRPRSTQQTRKSDKADAHTLADLVRTRRHQLRRIAADSDQAAAVKVVARAHQRLIWERTRHTLRLRSALRDYFRAALIADKPLGLAAADTLELLAKAPTPGSAAKLTSTQITAALQGRRRDIAAKATAIKDALRTPHLGHSDIVTSAYAADVRSTVAILQVLQEQIKTMQERVEAHFRQHPDAEIYLSQPGMGVITGAGCSQSSATPPAGTPTPRPGRTTPAPPRSPASPARPKASTPATSTTTGRTSGAATNGDRGPWAGVRRRLSDCGDGQLCPSGSGARARPSGCRTPRARPLGLRPRARRSMAPM